MFETKPWLVDTTPVPLGTRPPAEVINGELIVKRNDLMEVISHVGCSERCRAVCAVRPRMAWRFSLSANLHGTFDGARAMVLALLHSRVWKAVLGHFGPGRPFVRLLIRDIFAQTLPFSVLCSLLGVTSDKFGSG